MHKEGSFATVLINFSKIWLHKKTAGYIRTSFLFILLQVAVIIIFFSRLPPEIPLFFSLPWGEAQLAPPFFLLILPLISLAILLLNSLLATLTISANEFLASTLAFGSAIFSLFNLIPVLKVIARTL